MIQLQIAKGGGLVRIEGGRQIPIDEYDKRKNLGRNDKCYCESGKKYKKCCLNKHFEKHNDQKGEKDE